MIKGNAVLFSEMTPPEGEERAFNRWYEKNTMPGNVTGMAVIRHAQRHGARRPWLVQLMARRP